MLFKRKTYEEIEATGYTTSSGCFKIESDGNRFSVVPRRIVDWRVVVAVGCAILFSLCARYIEPDEATGDASFEVMYIIPAIATFIAIIILFAHVKGQRDEVRLGPVLHVDFSRQLVHLPRIGVELPAKHVVSLELVEMRCPAAANSDTQWQVFHSIRLVARSERAGSLAHCRFVTMVREVISQGHFSRTWMAPKRCISRRPQTNTRYRRMKCFRTTNRRYT